MTNESWEITRTLQHLQDDAFSLDIGMTLCTFTPEQAACLDRIIERLSAVARKRKPAEAA